MFPIAIAFGRWIARLPLVYFILPLLWPAVVVLLSGTVRVCWEGEDLPLWVFTVGDLFPLSLGCFCINLVQGASILGYFKAPPLPLPLGLHTDVPLSLTLRCCYGARQVRRIIHSSMEAGKAWVVALPLIWV